MKEFRAKEKRGRGGISTLKNRSGGVGRKPELSLMRVEVLEGTEATGQAALVVA